MAATKRNGDGQALEKQPQALGEDVEFILNPIKYTGPVHLQKKRIPTWEISTRQEKGTRGDRTKVIQQYVGVYDFVM